MTTSTTLCTMSRRRQQRRHRQQRSISTLTMCWITTTIMMIVLFASHVALIAADDEDDSDDNGVDDDDDNDNNVIEIYLPNIFPPVNTPNGTGSSVEMMNFEIGPADWIYADYLRQNGQEGGGGSMATNDVISITEDDKLLVTVLAVDVPAETVLARVIDASGFETDDCSPYACYGWLPLNNYLLLRNNEWVRQVRPVMRQTSQAGSKISEALKSLRVDDVRSPLPLGDPTLDGRTLRIGIISDSFNSPRAGLVPLTNYPQDITSGDLPANINIIKEFSQGASDEGRAMAQLMYDLVPMAQFAFYTGFGGIQDFANGIQILADNGCDVIVDDVVYFEEPFFQDGRIAQSANRVAQVRGIPYFSSAGNQDDNSWEGRFRFSGTNVILNGVNFGPANDFNPGTGVDFRQSVSVAGGTRFVLNWDDPFFSVSGAPGADTNIDLFVLQGGTNNLIAADTTINTGGDAIAQVFIPVTGIYDLVISLRSGPAPTLLKWIAFGGLNAVEFDTMSSTSYAQANQPFTAGVGAAFFQDTPEFGVSPPQLEGFSSRGGTPVLFNPNGSRKAIQEVRLQPRFVATDGNINTFFGQRRFFNESGLGFYFFGTSAAAPNAAAVALLIKQANPALTPTQIYGIMQDTAIDMTATPGFDFDSGFGYLDAFAAVNAAGQTPQPTSPPTPAPVPTATPTLAPVTTATPTLAPVTTATPTLAPGPTAAPTAPPTPQPTPVPSSVPSSVPSQMPSLLPSFSPSVSTSPSISVEPSTEPSVKPSVEPSISVEPSTEPSAAPSVAPSFSPTPEPTPLPTIRPPPAPSSAPSTIPSSSPSFGPTASPSFEPSGAPSSTPSLIPSVIPSSSPSFVPSATPSTVPSSVPSQSFAPTNLSSKMGKNSKSSKNSKGGKGRSSDDGKGKSSKGKGKDFFMARTEALSSPYISYTYTTAEPEPVAKTAVQSMATSSSYPSAPPETTPQTTLVSWRNQLWQLEFPGGN